MLEVKREKLPDTRKSITHKFVVSGHKGYITVSMYEDGRIGEMFIRMNKQGSTISGLMDTLSTIISIALQHGVPLKTIVDKLCYTRYEPSGFTQNSKIPVATSVADYIGKWLNVRFLDGTVPEDPTPTKSPGMESSADRQSSAPPCPTCGSITQRSGSCYACPTCGTSTGCG